MRVRRHNGCKILSVVCVTELGGSLISNDNCAILIRVDAILKQFVWVHTA